MSPLRRPLQFSFALLLGLTCVGLAGCPGELDPHLRMSGPTVCDAPAVVFDSKPNGTCTTLGCHDAMFKQGGLDLTADANLISRLVGVLPNGTNGSVCTGTTTPYLVDGTMPAQGLLLDKMFANPLPCGGQGNRMPSIGMLNADQTACIHEWADSVTAP